MAKNQDISLTQVFVFQLFHCRHYLHQIQVSLLQTLYIFTKHLVPKHFTQNFFFFCTNSRFQKKNIRRKTKPTKSTLETRSSISTIFIHSICTLRKISTCINSDIYRTLQKNLFTPFTSLSCIIGITRRLPEEIDQYPQTKKEFTIFSTIHKTKIQIYFFVRV